MAIFITFERRRRWIGTSISRSFNIFVNDNNNNSNNNDDDDDDGKKMVIIKRIFTGF